MQIRKLGKPLGKHVREWFAHPFSHLLPLSILAGLLSFGVFGWMVHRVIRIDKQEIYHYQNPIPIESLSFRHSAAIMGFPMVGGNRATLLNNGDEIFPAMLRDIRAAQHSVTLETFILRSDEAGQPFIEAMISTAKRGVPVRLLFDALGSTVHDNDVKRLKEAGVVVGVFRRLRSLRIHKASQRTHRKILVVDGRIAYSGGVGMGKEWLGNARNENEWRETQVRVEGPVASQMQSIFAENWLYTTGEVLVGDAYYPDLKPVGSLWAQGVGTARGDSSSYAKLLYTIAIRSARKKIYITNPYFMPDLQIREALRDAAERGVDVQLLLPGDFNDAGLIRAASWLYYRNLMKSGVKIFEYQPTMVHAKNMVVDGIYSTIGTINFDVRSMTVNAENTFAFYDRGFGSQMETLFEHDKKRSVRITPEKWKEGWAHRLILAVLALTWAPYY